MPDLRLANIRCFNAIYWQIGRFIFLKNSQQCSAFPFNQKKTCDLTEKFPKEVKIFGNNAQHEHKQKLRLL